MMKLWPTGHNLPYSHQFNGNIRLGKEANDPYNELCKACGVYDPDDFETNPLLFCAGCDLPIHTKCAGRVVEDESAYICFTCQAFNHKRNNPGRAASMSVRCFCCGRPGGALLPTTCTFK